MNGTEFRRRCVAAAISHGLDLGEAVAAAKEADAWCLAAAAEGETLSTRLALPSPAHFERRSRSEREAAEAAIPVVSRTKLRAPEKRNGRQAEAAPPRRHGPKPGGCARFDAGEYRARILRALGGAGARGLTRPALLTAAGCSQAALSKGIVAALAGGEIERLGGQRGRGICYRLKKSGGGALPPEVPRAASAPSAANENGVPSAAPVRPPAAPPRLPAVEREVLAALARAPETGFDVAALAAKTEYPGAAVQTALAALRADRAVHCPRPGKFALAGVTA